LPELGLSIGRTAHSEVSCEGDSVIVTERELFSALVFEIEDELRILAIFAGKDVLPLKNGCIKLRATVQHKAVFDDALDVVTTEHFARAIITRALSARQ